MPRKNTRPVSVRAGAVSRVCPWPPCSRFIQESQAACKTHWATLTPVLQTIWLAAKTSDDPDEIRSAREAIAQYAKEAA